VRRGDNTGKAAEGGGLSRPIGTNESEDLSWLNREGQVANRGEVAIQLGQRLDIDHRSEWRRSVWFFLHAGECFSVLKQDFRVPEQYIRALGHTWRKEMPLPFSDKSRNVPLTSGPLGPGLFSS
jgi:hypothetical protein